MDSAFDAHAPPAVTSWVDRAAGVMVALAGVWLLAAAWLSRVELYDGWEAQMNARVLLGWEGGRFIYTRGLFWSLTYVPVEALRRAFDISAADPRPFALVSAALHALYLWLCWRFIRRRHRDAPRAALIAFALAVPNVVFAVYGTFRSSDLLPGIVLLGMLLICWRYCRDPNPRFVIALGLLGLLAACFKPNLGALCWGAAVVALVACAPAGERWRRLLPVAAAGAASALVYWLLRAAIIAPGHDEGPWWILPWREVQQVSADIALRSAMFDARTYVVNIWAYGGAAVVLFGLGARGAWRDRTHGDRAVVVGWVSFVALALLQPAEVRYLAPLAPLTAWVAARGVDEIPSRLVVGLVVVLAFVDVGLVTYHASGTLSGVRARGHGELIEVLREREGPLLVKRGPSLVLEPAPRWPYDPFHGVAAAGYVHVAHWTDRPMFSTGWRSEAVMDALTSGKGTFVFATQDLLHAPRHLEDEDITAYRLVVSEPRRMAASAAIAHTPDGPRVTGAAAAWSHLALVFPDGRAVAVPQRGDGGLVPKRPLPASLDGVDLLGAAPLIVCDAWGRCSK